jgi:hypothetical protein
MVRSQQDVPELGRDGVSVVRARAQGDTVAHADGSDGEEGSGADDRQGAPSGGGQKQSLSSRTSPKSALSWR